MRSLVLFISTYLSLCTHIIHPIIKVNFHNVPLLYESHQFQARQPSDLHSYAPVDTVDMF